MSIEKSWSQWSTQEKGSPEYWKSRRMDTNWNLFTGSNVPADWLSVTLDDTEQRIACLIGKERRRRSQAEGRVNKFTQNCESFDFVDKLGACGEAAFAKATGRYWGMGIDTFKSGDVGEWEVRTRTDRHHDLKVSKDDPAGRYVALVYGCLDYRDIGGVSSTDQDRVDAGEPLDPLPCYRFYVAGYVLSDNARLPKYESNKPGFENVYLVPQKDLLPADLCIVRDWIKYYGMEIKAPYPSIKSYNDYNGGEYYPPALSTAPAQLSADLVS